MQWRNVMVVLVLVLLGGCKKEKLVQGKIVPAQAVFDLQGKEASLERWRGKGVYLNFWSAGCGGLPCRDGHAGSPEQTMRR